MCEQRTIIMLDLMRPTDSENLSKKAAIDRHMGEPQRYKWAMNEQDQDP
jgi:hypothetical protein